ncbi:MAG: hypothetical protein DWQ06_06290 [Calditrichaeota bacterium]|nr:MAG: hypothetical protein DWQ06_06290 [Calditrichota bacterium]
MHTFKKLLVFVGASLTSLSVLNAAEVDYVGSYNMRNVQSARTLDDGVFTFGMDLRGYDAGNDYTYVMGRWLFDYGITDNWQVSIVPTFYQDLNFSTRPSSRLEDDYNLPGDTQVGVKYSFKGLSEGKFDYSVGFALKATTGVVQNVVFEPYAADAYGGQLAFAGTWNVDPNDIPNSPKLHVNLNYVNHNDGGVNGGVSTEELFYSIGFNYFISRKWAVGIEYYGSYYIELPPKDTYGGVSVQRGSYGYISPRIEFVSNDWLKFFLNVDYRVLIGEDKEFTTASQTFDTYPALKINLGMEISSGPSYGGKTRYIDSEQLIEKIIKDEDISETEAELEVIRKERIKAEKELEELKRLLQEKNKK